MLKEFNYGCCEATVPFNEYSPELQNITTVQVCNYLFHNKWKYHYLLEHSYLSFVKGKNKHGEAFEIVLPLNNKSPDRNIRITSALSVLEGITGEDILTILEEIKKEPIMGLQESFTINGKFSKAFFAAIICASAATSYMAIKLLNYKPCKTGKLGLWLSFIANLPMFFTEWRNSDKSFQEYKKNVLK